jgi:hypothetical protein
MTAQTTALSTSAAAAEANEQLADLTDFYLPRSPGDPTLFEIWERGEARGDSVTPSTFCHEYRTWMGGLLRTELGRAGTDRLVSLGSGNAAVECELLAGGVRVLAVDAMAEAVQIARAKGLDAIRADITTWVPQEEWPVVYLDGLLGHLYDTTTGSLPVLAHIRSWLGSGGRGTLVASNDGTPDGSPVHPAPGVTGFHWLSEEYLAAQARAAGFDDVRTQTYLYERPLSGERGRSVLVARFGA